MLKPKIGLVFIVLWMISYNCAGQTTVISPNWECWIQEEDSNPVSISCIRDRSNYVPQPATSYEEGVEGALLQHIHEVIKSGDTTSLGEYITTNIDLFRRGSIYSIDVHIAPFASSWDEERPQMLVRSLLCTEKCTVTIAHPIEPAPPPNEKSMKKKRKIN